jgi:hypothetical protein
MSAADTTAGDGAPLPTKIRTCVVCKAASEGGQNDYEIGDNNRQLSVRKTGKGSAVTFDFDSCCGNAEHPELKDKFLPSIVQSLSMGINSTLLLSTNSTTGTEELDIVADILHKLVASDLGSFQPLDYNISMSVLESSNGSALRDLVAAADESKQGVQPQKLSLSLWLQKMSRVQHSSVTALVQHLHKVLALRMYLSHLTYTNKLEGQSIVYKSSLVGPVGHVFINMSLTQRYQSKDSVLTRTCTFTCVLLCTPDTFTFRPSNKLDSMSVIPKWTHAEVYKGEPEDAKQLAARVGVLNNGMLSLSALSRVAHVLRQVQSTAASSAAPSATVAPHIPFRESMLTRLLKGALLGNSQTYLLLFINRGQGVENVINSLRFAADLSNVRTSVRPRLLELTAAGSNPNAATAFKIDLFRRTSPTKKRPVSGSVGTVKVNSRSSDVGICDNGSGTELNDDSNDRLDEDNFIEDDNTVVDSSGASAVLSAGSSITAQESAADIFRMSMDLFQRELDSLRQFTDSANGLQGLSEFTFQVFVAESSRCLTSNANSRGTSMMTTTGEVIEVEDGEEEDGLIENELATVTFNVAGQAGSESPKNRSPDPFYSEEGEIVRAGSRRALSRPGSTRIVSGDKSDPSPAKLRPSSRQESPGHARQASSPMTGSPGPLFGEEGDGTSRSISRRAFSRPSSTRIPSAGHSRPDSAVHISPAGSNLSPIRQHASSKQESPDRPTSNSRGGRKPSSSKVSDDVPKADTDLATATTTSNLPAIGKRAGSGNLSGPSRNLPSSGSSASPSGKRSGSINATNNSNDADSEHLRPHTAAATTAKGATAEDAMGLTSVLPNQALRRPVAAKANGPLGSAGTGKISATTTPEPRRSEASTTGATGDSYPAARTQRSRSQPQPVNRANSRSVTRSSINRPKTVDSNSSGAARAASSNQTKSVGQRSNSKSSHKNDTASSVTALPTISSKSQVGSTATSLFAGASSKVPIGSGDVNDVYVGPAHSSNAVRFRDEQEGAYKYASPSPELLIFDQSCISDQSRVNADATNNDADECGNSGEDEAGTNSGDEEEDEDEDDREENAAEEINKSPEPVVAISSPGVPPASGSPSENTINIEVKSRGPPLLFQAKSFKSPFESENQVDEGYEGTGALSGAERALLRNVQLNRVEDAKQNLKQGANVNVVNSFGR